MKIKKNLFELIKNYDCHKYCKQPCDKCPLYFGNDVYCYSQLSYIAKNKPETFSEEFKNREVEVEVEKPKPTKEEITFLKMLKPEYKWIAKEKKEVCVFESKPRKFGDYWFDRLTFVCLNFLPYNFDFLSWEDEEPTNIQELIKGYEDDTD